MAVEQQPPAVLAMILADTVLLDVATDKHTIQGMYQALHVKDFPYAHSSIVVYVLLTDGYGDTPVQLRLLDVDEVREPIFELESMVRFPDPLSLAEVIFRQSRVVFPEPGDYRLQLFASGSFLQERRLQIFPEPDADM